MTEFESYVDVLRQAIEDHPDLSNAELAMGLELLKQSILATIIIPSPKSSGLKP